MALLENLKGKKIILASKSPRRQELLKGLELDFEIRTKEVDEIYPEELAPERIPEYLAELKAAAFIDELSDDELLITADTIVILNGKVLEKPQNRDHAIEMVSELSSNTHTVITGVSITTNGETNSLSDATEVTFRKLTRKEIEHYIDTYQPYDKAGSYGVQELIGYIAIEKLEGSFYNVMGLPLHRVYEKLKEI